jgi:hypothetical protein
VLLQLEYPPLAPVQPPLERWSLAFWRVYEQRRECCIQIPLETFQVDGRQI